MNAAYAMVITLLAEVVSVLYLLLQISDNKKKANEQRDEKTERYPFEPLLGWRCLLLVADYSVHLLGF